MDFSDDAPMVGPADVDREALAERGVSLAELVAALGVSLDLSSATDAPPDGWRVLKRYQSGAMVIGAPTESTAAAWRVAHLDAPNVGAVVMVQPDPMPLRPSRAERRRGLELRWPAVVSENPVASGYFVDIVNTGSSRWRSDGDGFYVVGAFTNPGSTGFDFAWVSSSQHRPVPLDPGEYARVPVSINPSTWNSLEPHTYDLQAVLVSLGLRTIHPLRVEVSAELIAQHRQQNARSHSSPERRRRALDQQIERVRAQIAAGDALHHVVDAVAASQSDDDAITRISHLLKLDGDLARSVYHSSLSEPSSSRSAQREKQLEQLTQQRANA
ncbi:hypothetical protein [Microbacterium sp. B35-30]|uniref:hypothetical protein n=1 Tax=Microbacterium sp. B35-30 TaxID=1962642 RepID=UPI0013D1092A|nr:hypothetical protein [Microbacterium sp. B35-30]